MDIQKSAIDKEIIMKLTVKQNCSSLKCNECVLMLQEIHVDSFLWLDFFGGGVWFMKLVCASVTSHECPLIHWRKQ